MLCSDLNKMLICKFPHLQEKYLEEVSWQEGDATGSHIVYGDILTPYLKECILKEYEHEVQSVFDFLEGLLELENEYVENVVFCSVLESIAYLFKEKSFLIAFLGKRCKNAINAVP